MKLPKDESQANLPPLCSRYPLFSFQILHRWLQPKEIMNTTIDGCCSEIASYMSIVVSFSNTTFRCTIPIFAVGLLLQFARFEGSLRGIYNLPSPRCKYYCEYLQACIWTHDLDALASKEPREGFADDAADPLGRGVCKRRRKES